MPDEWFVAADGRRRWGRYGAAGILAATRPPRRVLLVRRAGWVHGGRGQWSIPGGALLAGETAIEAAAREFAEEMGSLPAWHPLDRYVDDVVPGEWSYTTILAECADQPDYSATLSDEHDEHVWAPVDEARRMDLFAPFARVLPRLLATLDVRSGR
ncbi:NUDIX hydrolase [Amycolatopsis sp. FU40]|uniref:NUDIX domain-containing protein n=1 Tax=Amycolatopsis sp. FU40 TaxID=2914159 RepID=UPI001F404C91|nr:NUDIX hydrolase [Amycolatopsis sp. FU40]UKD57724.1 NUDIX hydrolase [Amycolatopsis sp. FU40]